MSVRLKSTILGVLFCWAGGLCAEGAAHTQARLILSAETARRGETVQAGVHLRMDANWHTYWKNSGQSGQPTTIDWELPTGVTAGEVQWPLPEKLTEVGMTTYIYKDEVVLLVPLKLAADLKPGPIELKAKVVWLECEIQCIPGSANVQTKLNIGEETKASKDAEQIAAWQKKVPNSNLSWTARASWDGPPAGDTRAILIEWNSTNASATADFFPYASEQFEVQANTEQLQADAGKVRLRARVQKLGPDWPEGISGVLVQQETTERIGCEVDLELGSAGLASAAPGSKPASLWKTLLYALLGGLILNVMPCVLPVIGLKILGFVGQAAGDPTRVRKLGIIYCLGVLVSFLVLAALVIGLKVAGHRVGWGMQFSNPQFVVLMTILVTLVALSLFGLFEINLSGRVMGAAGTLSAKQGAGGAFFNGVLATLLATPCTAPILAPALGFAFLQGPAMIILIFLVVGLGLALPYVLLSWHPTWLEFLPKPGAWMEKFKIAMGFPMLATAIWLLSLTPIHFGDRSWWLGMFLVLIALAAWVFGEFVQKGRKARGVAMVIAALILVGGYIAILEGKLEWRAERKIEVGASRKLANAPKGLAWETWSTEAVAKARAEGRPVIVDFTAEWCLTCNTIVKPALENAAVQKKLKETSTAMFLADFTLIPPAIGDELERYGRKGVPLVLVYPKNSNEPPMVYDVVTSGTVLKALDEASK
jgi:thiol:disulfide interchange protein